MDNHMIMVDVPDYTMWFINFIRLMVHDHGNHDYTNDNHGNHGSDHDNC